MNYQDKAVPVTNAVEIADAIGHGAQFEYTYFPGDRYDLPRWPNPDCEGWVDVAGNLATLTALLEDTRGKVRAFYPIQNHDAYMAAARTLRDEE